MAEASWCNVVMAAYGHVNSAKIIPGGVRVRGTSRALSPHLM